MGLKEITAIRQFTDFTVDGKVRKMYEVTFTTQKAEGEFTLDLTVEEYTAEKARERAAAQAVDIDAVIG